MQCLQCTTQEGKAAAAPQVTMVTRLELQHPLNSFPLLPGGLLHSSVGSRHNLNTTLAQ